MADGRGQHQAEPSSVLFDSRTAKKLDPVRLPSKLRERVEKAQRRAAAAKDGACVTIFTSTSGSISSALSGSASAGGLGPRLSVSTIQRSTSMLNVAWHQAGNAHQQRGSAADPESGEAGGKMHLPQMVLRHKMREFEAKMNASSALSDPLDAGGVLSRLSIEDKERVMARMQDKIRDITGEIEVSFMRIRREMDTHGVFDEAANYQRAQTMCLVELQRRCRLEKLRDEAVDEILGVTKSPGGERKMSSASFGAGTIDGKAAASARRMEKNLSSLFHSPEHQQHASDSHTQRRHIQEQALHRAQPTNSRSQKRAAILPRIPADARRSSTVPAGASSPSREAAAPGSPAGRRGKRGGGGDASEAEQPNTVEASNGSANEIWTRHPHVLHAIQALNAGKEPNKGNASGGGHGSARGDGELEMESDRRLSSAEEWQERSASYRVIAQRTASELWRRAGRQRWDSTAHFTSASTGLVPSADLRTRLEAQQLRLLRSYGDADGAQEDEEREKREHESTAVNESLPMRRQRTAQEYATLQAQIIERLAKWNRQHVPNLSAAASIRRRPHQQLRSSHGRESDGVPLVPSLMPQMEQTDEVATPKSEALARPASTAGLLSTREPATSDSSEQPTDQPDQYERSDLPELGGSASLPVFETTAMASPSPASLLTLGSRPGTRHRLSLLERRLLASQQPEQHVDGAWALNQRGSLRPSRRGCRRESRIGAPPPVPDFTTFGRHSDARMAERRYSAQTWAWHASDGVNAGEQDDLDEEVSDEDDDEFDDALLEEGDENEEGDEGDAEESGDQFRRPRLRHNKSGLSSLAVSRDGSHVVNDTDSEDARSMASWSSHMPQSARSMASVATTTMSITSKRIAQAGTGASSGSRRRHASKRRVGGTNKGTNGSRRHAALSGDALSLHLRLEGIWKALEFPFSHKLLMVEKYAELVEDSGAFERALKFWEVCARAVVVRERMKSALAEFADRQEIKNGSRLDPDEVAALAAAVREGRDGESDGEIAIGLGHAVDAQLVSALSVEGYIKWVNDNIGSATAWCQQAAGALKDATGDELEFQGAPYPPRSISGSVKDV